MRAFCFINEKREFWGGYTKLGEPLFTGSPRIFCANDFEEENKTLTGLVKSHPFLASCRVQILEVDFQSCHEVVVTYR